MHTAFSHSSAPNPAKLIESLRSLGYDNYHAIADLLDNSLDADSKNIKIIVHTRNGEPEIIIADDGIGMDVEILDQAIRLGSLVEKDCASDLGKFGMGLCTASLSICRQTVILTKTQDGNLLKAINDVDEVKRTNEFVSFFGEPSEEDTSLFQDILGKSGNGTVVILRKCDNLQDRNLAQFSKTLAKRLARIFRYFIAADRVIYVNNDKLPLVDPLLWDNPQTTKYDDGQIEIEIRDGDRVIKDVIRVKLAILPENPAIGEKSREFNIKTQGFYVLRNNREVLDAVTLDLFNKHNDYNRFRGEIHFSGTLDKWLGVNFTKRDVNLHQSVRDQLEKYLGGQITTIRTQIRKEQRVETPADVAEVHKGVEDEIRRKSKLLMTPKAPKEKRKPHIKKNEHTTTLDDPARSREPREQRQPGGIAANCKFETASMGETGAIYEVGQQGRTVIVRWNSDHPFYQRFVLENIQDKKMVSAADFLVYSLACAELMWFNDNEDAIVLLNNMKTVMSANMRTLLS